MTRSRPAETVYRRSIGSDVELFDQGLDVRDRFVEGLLVIAFELEFDDSLDPARSKHARHADIQTIDTVLQRIGAAT